MSKSSEVRAAHAARGERPLHIALCLSWYRPIESGAERQAHRQAVELVRRGHRVTVLTRSVPNTPSRECANGVEIRRVIRPLELGPAFGLTFVMTLARQLHALRRDVDIVHCHQALWEAVAAGWFQQRTGIPTLIQPAAGGYFGEVEILSRTKGARWLRRYVLANTHFVAISQQIEDELRHMGVAPQRVDRLASGVDVTEYSPGVSAAEPLLPPGPRVLFLGRLHPQKNLSLLLRAWQLVRQQRQDATLLLAGEGPQRSELERGARQLEIEDSVRFLGAVAKPVEFLRAAAVFVLPSLSEGMSNSLLEAMACAVPVIVSDAGGNVDLVQHDVNGLVVNTRDAAVLAEALLRLLADAALCRRLGTAARQHIESHYSLEALVDRYEHLYRRLLA